MDLQTRVVFQLALYGGAIGGGLILLGLLSFGGAGYVATNPPVEEIPGEEIDVQQFSTDVSHSAIVTRQTPLYDRGEELSDMPVYFTNVTPRLTVSITTSVPGDRSVDVTHRLTVTHVATFNDREFWSRERVLVDEGTTVQDGEYRSNVTIEIPEVLAGLESAQSATDGIGTMSTNLQLETTYSAASESGGTYEGSLSATAPLELTDPAYWVDGSLSDSQTHSQRTEPGVRELPPDMGTVGLLAGLGLLSIVAGGGVLRWRSTSVDLRTLENEVVRSRYDEWISNGEFPTGSGNRYIHITSLEDLVDVGIDSNKRVIYDPNLDTYCVADGDLIYYHAADPTNIESWLGLSSGGS